MQCRLRNRAGNANDVRLRVRIWEWSSGQVLILRGTQALGGVNKTVEVAEPHLRILCAIVVDGKTMSC
jgi:hypothetical protein